MLHIGRRSVPALVCFLLSLLLCCKNDDDPVQKKSIQLQQAYIGPVLLTPGSQAENIPVDGFFLVTFDTRLNVSSVANAVTLTSGGQNLPLNFSFLDGDRTVKISPLTPFQHNTIYQLVISDGLTGINSESFAGETLNIKTVADQLRIESADIGGQVWSKDVVLQNVKAENLVMQFNFDHALNPAAVSANSIKLSAGNVVVPVQIELLNGNRAIKLTITSTLRDFVKHTLSLSSISGTNGETMENSTTSFYTGVSSINDFPAVSDDQLLTLVQKQTFMYFYDFAHPASGMARERNSSGSTVTSGGTGFGIMALIVGIERGFITRQQGLERMDRILDFLETADRFHGVWPHWLNGDTGKVVPFSAKDNGGDLVETSFLVQGLLTFRQYLNAGDANELSLINRINTLWQSVEWDWYRNNNQNVLYWHWSPTYGWEMNFPMYGYYEEQITYFLAAASPTHSIPKVVYSNGYGKNGAIVKNNIHYGIKLPLENPAPLFWVHYSYLGLDPHFSDDYANYWEQNVSATLINHAYCVANPKKFVGYSDECWGLTSSDNQNGYGAHSPTNDLGVITPTAALSSFPYTPAQSMKALKFFYYKLGDRLWGQYGFYDAFNLTEGWTANSYLAIDQGPIIVMIENYRTQKLWDLFMSAPEVQAGISALSFRY
ncbi:MAG TPA: glucoamylase family protein [Chryseosolibacter sp.]